MGKGLQEFHFYDIDRRGCIRMQFYQVVETWRAALLSQRFINILV